MSSIARLPASGTSARKSSSSATFKAGRVKGSKSSQRLRRPARSCSASTPGANAKGGLSVACQP
jgi:hypothetical protein